MSFKPSCKYLGCDISLGKPGFAIILVENRRAKLVESFHIKTNPKSMRGTRYQIIEERLSEKLYYHWFEVIIRESFHSKIPDTNAAVFGAWASVDRALAGLNMEVTAQYTAQQIKKTVTGKARAEKPEVAVAVRKLLELPEDHKFASDDESDACAIVLTYLLKEGLIDEPL